MKQFWCIVKLVVDHCFEIDFISWYWQKTSSKLLQNLQGLWQYSWVLYLQVDTFFKYWRNTQKFYHNTCKWEGDFTQQRSFKTKKTILRKHFLSEDEGTTTYFVLREKNWSTFLLRERRRIGNGTLGMPKDAKMEEEQA